MTHTVHNESHWKKLWRPVCAYVYLMIVIFDFMIMPAVFEYNDRVEPAVIIEQIVKLPTPEGRIAALNTFTTKRSWSPLTVLGGGLFHVSFGAILGIAAYTRGQEKLEHARNGRHLT